MHIFPFDWPSPDVLRILDTVRRCIYVSCSIWRVWVVTLRKLGIFLYSHIIGIKNTALCSCMHVFFSSFLPAVGRRARPGKRGIPAAVRLVTAVLSIVPPSKERWVHTEKCTQRSTYHMNRCGRFFSALVFFPERQRLRKVLPINAEQKRVFGNIWP